MATFHGVGLGLCAELSAPGTNQCLMLEGETPVE